MNRAAKPAAKPRRGRPPRAGTASLAPISVRLTTDERASLDRIAASLGWSAVEVIRDALSVYAEAADSRVLDRYAGHPGDLIRVAVEQIDPDDEAGELVDLARDVLRVAEEHRIRREQGT